MRLYPTHTALKPLCALWLGDCRKILKQFRRYGRLFDLCFADPPFNKGEPYACWNDKMPWSDYLDFTREWLDACLHVLQPHGALWVNCPDSLAADVVKYVRDERNMTLVNWVIWTYRFGVHRKTNFIVSKSHVLYFAGPDKRNRRWNPWDILVPSDRASKYKDDRTDNKDTDQGLRVPMDVWGNDGEKYFGRVQGNNKERNPVHPNQLPEVYLERVIRACSNEGDTVLDPFLGSGTTCVVARALNRISTGIEIDPKYIVSAWERVQAGAVRVKGNPP